MIARGEQLGHIEVQQLSIVTIDSKIVKYEESRHPPDRFEVVQRIESEGNEIYIA